MLRQHQQDMYHLNTGTNHHITIVAVVATTNLVVAATTNQVVAATTNPVVVATINPVVVVVVANENGQTVEVMIERKIKRKDIKI